MRLSVDNWSAAVVGVGMTVVVVVRCMAVVAAVDTVVVVVDSTAAEVRAFVVLVVEVSRNFLPWRIGIDC